MEQLIMRWKNDGTEPAPLPSLPSLTVKNWNETDRPLDKWLDIVRYGLSEKKEDEAFWHACNKEEHPSYQPSDCYFFLWNGEEVGTATVIRDTDRKEGYLHMVALKEEARGLGIGNYMAAFAVKVLKDSSMDTAYLTTDDSRIPAIKSYLKSGFYPDRSTADFQSRWDAIEALLKKNTNES